MEINILKNIMANKGVTAGELAQKTGIFKLKLYLGLGGMVEFTGDEIVRIAKALELSKKDVEQIFFGK